MNAPSTIIDATKDYYVVVCENDQPHPRFGLDDEGPIVYERYLKYASKAEATEFIECVKEHGKCHIAKLVFEPEE
jgi:ABC-type molybdate transport system substrate-binding protein